MNDEQQLLPCPFCDGMDIAVWTNHSSRMTFGPSGYVVICGNRDCQAEGPWDLGASGAIAKWNARAEAVQPYDIRKLIAEVARLRAALERAEEYMSDSGRGAIQTPDASGGSDMIPKRNLLPDDPCGRRVRVGSTERRGKSMKVHRWQPTGRTPCGREVSKVATNRGHYLDAGVTCLRCQAANTRFSMLFDDWNGQSEGAADERIPGEKENHLWNC